MKKIILGFMALGVMSFTTYQTVENFRLTYALENMEEMHEYMHEDIKDGTIDPVIGEIYLEIIDETMYFLDEEINK